MNVMLTASLVSPEDNKVVHLEREITLPFPPFPGLMLNGLHPDKDGWSIKVEIASWDHKAQKLYADVNPVCVDMGENLDEEAHKWVVEGWKIVEIEELYLSDEVDEGDDVVDEGGEGCDPVVGGDLASPVKTVSDGGRITIHDCVVNIYNGGTAEVDQRVEPHDE